MPSAILDGLSVVDTTGCIILGSTIAVLFLGVATSALVHARYARLERDLKRNPSPGTPFAHAVLNRIVRDVEATARGSRELITQAIIEERFQSDLKGLLLAERFVKAATGLAIILGLLGTFYGLTLSVGRLVHLVAADAPVASDVTATVGKGLTQALSGMAVAFSNSLFGVASAVVLTVFGVLWNVTDRRVALMVQIETYVDRALSAGAIARAHPDAGLGESVIRLEGAVARFEAALQAFAGSTREFLEFNSHLKDNIQRMSLSFGDFSETLKNQIVALRSADRN
jgi:hypothetical protein